MVQCAVAQAAGGGVSDYDEAGKLIEEIREKGFRSHINVTCCNSSNYPEVIVLISTWGTSLGRGKRGVGCNLLEAMKDAISKIGDDDV